MYFGDWLRTSEIKHIWFVSYSSDRGDFVSRAAKALGKKGQIQELIPHCVMIESVEPMKQVVKHLRKVLLPGEEAIFIYPHHKMLGHIVLTLEDD